MWLYSLWKGKKKLLKSGVRANVSPLIQRGVAMLIMLISADSLSAICQRGRTRERERKKAVESEEEGR